MKKLILIATIVLFVVGSVWAASIHLKGGKHAEPTFTDNGFTLSASGELSGLGNVDTLITINAEALVDARCGNPGTNTWQAPGQNPAPVSVTGAVSIPAEEVKNGWTSFSVETLNPFPEDGIIVGAPDCPNPRWTEEVVGLTFTSATITVQQPEGTVVFAVACTFDPSTSDGVVPAGNVECTSF